MARSLSLISSLGLLVLTAVFTPACGSQSAPTSGGTSPGSTDPGSTPQTTPTTEAPTGATDPGTTAPGTTAPGTTTPGTTATCSPDKEPNREYRMRDSAQCKAALFQCPAGSKAFFNDCGCGCEKP